MANKAEQFRNMARNISEVDPLIIAKEEKIAANSPFRQKFHIEPKSGFLNDPNGFAYFNGEYHLFYQWTPLAYKENPTIWHHGWYHLASTDLIHWKDLGPAIESDCDIDKHGTYSGSAITVGDKLFCIYTGNTWTDTDTDNWKRLPYQVGAWMDKNNCFEKISTPLISDTFSDCTGHFRDPKIWRHGDEYYAVVGAQRKDLTGTVKVIKSIGEDLTKWEKHGEINTGESNFGYMWECPDYFEIGSNGILLFSPQGLKSEGEYYNNIYQTGYFVGEKLNYETLEFKHGKFHEIDAGFDFYAAQTMEAPDGRRIMIAWFGISEMVYPTVDYHYSGCLTIPRELKVVGDRVLQQPIREMKQLRKKVYTQDIEVSDIVELDSGEEVAQELELEIDMENATYFELDLRANPNNSKQTKLIFDKENQKCILSRKDSGIPISEEYGTKRSRHLKIEEKIKVRIFIDISSIEVFIGDGENVFSARIFPDETQNRIFAKSIGGVTHLKGNIWNI